MYLNIRSEFSYRSTFAPIDKIVSKCKSSGFAGITDINNTFGHVPFEKECVKQGVFPFFGVSLPVVEELDIKDRRGHLNFVYIIALTQKGLVKIYRSVETAYKQFWHTPRLTYKQLDTLPVNDVIIISGYAFQNQYSTFIKPYQMISPGFPKGGINPHLKPIACVENHYINKNDKEIYEAFADENLLDRKTFPQHLLTHQEWNKICKCKPAIKNLLKVVKKAELVKLQKAPLVKYNHKSPEKKLIKLCQDGAKNLKLDITSGKYGKQYQKEIEIIKEKGFIDYFLLASDLVKDAKKTMMVGSGRGSSGGSLVCLLLGITLIDPIKYDLIFERFIDINRTDLPDIDIDFQHDKRSFVIKNLGKKYHVAQIANISRLTPKANLNRIAKHLFIPDHNLTGLKNMASDQKADAIKLETMLNDTEPGQRLSSNYPQMKMCINLENHALHSSVHAAGIIVNNKPITNFCSINSRDGVAQVDMSGCEYLDLLKIDALGLKTLTVLAETLDQLEFDYDFLYNLKDGDKKAYKVINSGKLTGIFQFEGRTMKKLIENTKIKSILDIAAFSALGRPGPMIAGSAKRYIKRKKGAAYELPDNHKTIKEITKETYGVIVYQEQIMKVAREYAGMKWKDVILLRKAVAKSKGSEELRKFRKKFIKGAKGKNPDAVWDMIKSFGSYGFVKAHAVAYAVTTYWCAYLKAHYPVEFAVAMLNVSDDDNKSVEILRYIDKEENIQHIHFDKKHSGLKWSVYKGKVLAPLVSIHGIGIMNARKIIKLRNENKPFPDGIQKHLDNCITPFKYIYPRKQIYKYFKGTDIEDITKKGKHTIIVKLIKKSLRDANSIEKVNDRGYEVDGPTIYLNIIVADDTGDIMCIINRFNYKKYGIEISEHGEENKDWYKIQGDYEPGTNLFFVEKIKRITINV